MRAIITPSVISGSVTAPPSKSMAHRALISAALAHGKSVIRNIALSEDISATAECLSALGADIRVDGNTATVIGFDPMTGGDGCELNVRESGSTLRFLIPICLLGGRECVLRGARRLFERPLGIYEDICRKYGLRFERGENSVTVQGVLKSGCYEMSGEISSQFVSGLMFALPLLEGNSEILLTGNPESKPYIDMTSEMLAGFGVTACYDGCRKVEISARQKYVPTDITVEGDCSNAAFFEAFNYVGGNVRVIGLKPDTKQGDAVYADYFGRLMPDNCLPLEDCPDLAPIMFAMAAEKGGCSFSGTKRLVLKESNRISAMAKELAKFGATVESGENRVTVHANGLHAPGAALDSHNDHRIAMALSVIATKYGGTVSGCEAVAKSMPDFYKKLATLGGKVELSEN